MSLGSLNRPWPPPPYRVKSGEEQELQGQLELLHTWISEANAAAQKGKWMECKIYLENSRRLMDAALGTAAKVLPEKKEEPA